MDSAYDYLIVNLALCSAMLLLVTASLWCMFVKLGSLTKVTTLYFRKECHRIQLLDLMSQKVEHQQEEIDTLRKAVCYLYRIQVAPHTTTKDIQRVMDSYNVGAWD